MNKVWSDNQVLYFMNSSDTSLTIMLSVSDITFNSNWFAFVVL